MDIRSGIIETARALGISPVDLGTAISYETGGTFDPQKAGPTTQWGQHRGLIQFGEPQAREFGVDWSNPVGSQLGANGAVAKYLRKTGVRPGMGLLDVYSAINAGGVGRYGASDAQNGGAPGTVADKVNQQMSGHRKNAMALLGGDQMQAAGGNAVMSGGAGEDTMQDEQGWLSPDKRDALIIALEGMTMNPNAALVGMAGQGIADRRQDARTQKQVNATAAWLRSQGREDLAAAVEGGVMDGSTAASTALAPPAARETVVVGDKLVDRQTGEVIFAEQSQDPSATVEWLRSQGRDDLAAAVGGGVMPATDAVKSAMEGAQTKGTEFGLAPIYGTDADGNVVVMQLGKDGTAIATKLPEGVEPDLGVKSYQSARAGAEGKALGEDVALRESTSSKMDGLKQVVSELDDLADKATYTMAGQAVDFARKQAGLEPRESAIARATYIAKVDNQVLPMLRDTFGAAFTVKEGETLRATLGDPDKSPAEKKEVLRAFIAQKQRDLEALQIRTKNTPTDEPAQTGVLKYNPATGDFE